MKPTHKRYKKIQSFFENLPHGLTHGEVAERLGKPINTTTRWGKRFGYSFVDGRSRGCHRLTEATRTRYQQTLSFAARQGLTLEKSGSLLGFTKERARQLFGIFQIKR